LLALTITATACSSVLPPLPSILPGTSPPKPQNKTTPVPTGDYKQFFLGLVKTPQGVEGGNGGYDDAAKFIVLINNKNAADPTYSQLVTFLQQDQTDKFPYQLQLNPNTVYFDKPENLVDVKRVQNIIDGSVQPNPPLICADFAERLHNNAELAGIRCGYVTIDFEAKPIGHALAVFNTTDMGLVYIDDTGVDKVPDFNIGQNSSAHTISSNDKVAYFTVGKAYGLITLENAANFGVNYTGYDKWLSSQQDLDAMETKFKDLQTQIIPIRTQIDDMDAQYAILKIQYDSITGGRTVLPPNTYNQALPVMNKMNAVNGQRNALIDTLNGLVSQVNSLVDQYNGLVKKMGPTWDSLGTVSNFYVTWDGNWQN
jgi:hypothetical protein